MFALAIDYKDSTAFHRRPPIFASPKLNGVRAMWLARERKLVSRDGKVFRADILPALYDALGAVPINLDGELYVHGTPFATIAGAVGIHRNEPSDLSRAMEFHVFDLPADGRIAILRLESLLRFSPPAPKIKVVPHVLLKDAAALDTIYDSYVRAGYEGAVYKNPLALYHPKRTPYFIKRKAWKDGEFAVLSVNRGEGVTNANTIGSLTCITDGGVEFSVTLTDALERDAWIERAARGKDFPRIKIRYLELSAHGKPYQPIYEGVV
jgi:ATP-dependent DNA ligase